MPNAKKLLIAYDGSLCADSALDDLQRAGLPEKVDALVVSVAEVWLPMSPPSSTEIVAEAREVHVPSDLKRVYARKSKEAQDAFNLAHDAASRLQAMFPRWSVESVMECGSPAAEIMGKADEWQPDLIVLGSHGRTALNRLMLGSVSQSVLSAGKCSVRVARGRVDEPGLPVRILIGVDGSTGSEAAVREVANRDWASGTEVRLVVVEDPLTPTFIGRLIPPLAEIVEESTREDLQWIEKELAKCVLILSERGLQVSTTIREGEPKRVLIQVADEWRSDSIFVGATGFSNRLERFVLGSVSSAIAARASCSVEVVRSRRY